MKEVLNGMHLTPVKSNWQWEKVNSPPANSGHFVNSMSLPVYWLALKCSGFPWNVTKNPNELWGQPYSKYGEGNGTPLQYSCLENPMDGGAWWAAVHGVTQSRTWLERLRLSNDLPGSMLNSLLSFLTFTSSPMRYVFTPILQMRTARPREAKITKMLNERHRFPRQIGLTTQHQFLTTRLRQGGLLERRSYELCSKGEKGSCLILERRMTYKTTDGPRSI